MLNSLEEPPREQHDEKGPGVGEGSDNGHIAHLQRPKIEIKREGHEQSPQQEVGQRRPLPPKPLTRGDHAGKEEQKHQPRPTLNRGSENGRGHGQQPDLSENGRQC